MPELSNDMRYRLTNLLSRADNELTEATEALHAAEKRVAIARTDVKWLQEALNADAPRDIVIGVVDRDGDFWHKDPCADAYYLQSRAGRDETVFENPWTLGQIEREFGLDKTILGPKA